MKQRKFTFALLVLMLAFAGCKSESPTAPPLGNGTGVTPPTNASLALTASNSSQVVNMPVTITATVTQSGQNVPNGTAVQFTTNFGTFSDAGTQCTSGSPSICTVLKTTTNGVATVTLTSSVQGTSIVTAAVNNAAKSVTVIWSNQSVGPPPSSNVPTITGVNPATGLPAGGQQVTITGTNFNAPVRVLFDIHDGSPKVAQVASVSATQIVVLTPAINLVTAQTQAADVIVITQAGTGNDQRVVGTGAFTYTAAILTPDIRALQPTSGPIDGGTRVTIIGDAFQAPVQVFFGAAEAQVISINFNQIIVSSPKADDTQPNGAGPFLGSVDVKVVNVNSNKSVTFPGGFRYITKVQITTFGPGEGPFTGGTRVTIDGAGFTAPVAVSIGGFSAQVISVSATEIVAITGPVTTALSCADVSGPVVVANTNNGDGANSTGSFFYRVPRPLITNVSNPNNLGGTATITVLNALGFPNITINGVLANITATVTNPDGTTTFTVQIPSTLTLATTSCPAGGSVPQPSPFTVVYTSATTGCTITCTNCLTVNPANAPVLFLNPGAFQPFTATITPATIGPPPAPAKVSPSGTQTINVVNNGTTLLNITAITQTPGTGAGCTNFAVAAPPVPPTIGLNSCEALPVSVKYNGQIAPTTDTCTLTITTNAGSKSLLLVGSSQ